MTLTPRTDAVAKKRDTSGQNSSVYRWVEEVSAKFARQLERENAELLAALEILSTHGHDYDCLLLNRANESCDCGLDFALAAIAKAKGVQP